MLAWMMLSGVLPALAQDKALSEEDIILAQMDIFSLSKLAPAAKAEYKLKTVGIDSRVNKVITEDYVCGDVCPENGSLFLSYKGVDTTKQCSDIRGYAKLTPGWGGYAGCQPVAVTFNLILRSGEKIEGAVYRGNTEYFLRLAKLKDASPGIFLSEAKFSSPDDLSIFLNDIDHIESASGNKLEAFKSALRIPVISGNPAEQAGRYYKAAGEKTTWPREAIVLLNKAVELDPRLFDAYYALAKLYGADQSRPGKEIIPLFEKLIKLDPDDAQAYYILGTAYFGQVEFGQKNEAAYKAAAMLEKTVSLDPNKADAYFWLSKLYANVLNNYPEAVKNKEKWIELSKPQGEKAEAEYSELNAYKQLIAR